VRAGGHPVTKLKRNYRDIATTQQARGRHSLSKTASARACHFHTGLSHFGNASLLLLGACIAATTSRGLGKNDIDQAVINTNADRIAAVNVKPVRMTPPPGSSAPAGFHLALALGRKNCELRHIDRRLFAARSSGWQASVSSSGNLHSKQ